MISNLRLHSSESFIYHSWRFGVPLQEGMQLGAFAISSSSDGRLNVLFKRVEDLNCAYLFKSCLLPVKLQILEHGSPLQTKPRVWSKARTLTSPWHLPSKRIVPGEGSNNNAASSTVGEAATAVMAVPTIAVNGESVDSVEGNEEDDAEDGFVLPKTRKRTRRRKTVPNNVRMKNL